MTISTVGSHTVSSCPYCDKLLTVFGTGADGLRAMLALLQEHLDATTECKATHQRTVRLVFSTLASNPLSAAFLEDVMPHEQLHDDDLLDVAKITRDGESDPYYLEASDLAAIPTKFGTENRFTIEWVRMTVKQYDSLPQFNKPAVPCVEVLAVAQDNEH